MYHISQPQRARGPKTRLWEPRIPETVEWEERDTPVSV